MSIRPLYFRANSGLVSRNHRAFFRYLSVFSALCFHARTQKILGWHAHAFECTDTGSELLRGGCCMLENNEETRTCKLVSE